MMSTPPGRLFSGGWRAQHREGDVGELVPELDSSRGGCARDFLVLGLTSGFGLILRALGCTHCRLGSRAFRAAGGALGLALTFVGSLMPVGDVVAPVGGVWT